MQTKPVNKPTNYKYRQQFNKFQTQVVDKPTICIIGSQPANQKKLKPTEFKQRATNTKTTTQDLSQTN